MKNYTNSQFLNIDLSFELGVILERSENQRFERAKDPIKNLWPKAILLMLETIKKPSANLFIWILRFASLARKLRSRMTQNCMVV